MALQPIDFAGLMPEVAARLLGPPNQRMSKGRRLRFGTHGSMEVDTSEGWFADHEAKVNGGVLDLIRHKEGCDTAAALRWLEDEGFKERTKREPPPEVSQIGPRRAGAILYDYRAENGAILSRVKRTPDKRFLQLGPDGKGGFHAAPGCMQGVRRVPYRLPELLASERDRAIFVVEGEKDADRLASAGLIATCNAEGAGKFRLELVEHFAGRRVVVLADNDDVGFSHANDVAAKLAGTAEVVTILALPDLPPKGDVSDWLDDGGTIERLKELAQAALERPIALLSHPEEAFALADLAVWANTAPTPKSFVMAPFIPRDDVVIVTGDGGTNKSTLALQISACAAANRPMLGIEVQAGHALYVTAEDDERENHWRLDKIARAIGTTLHDLIGRLHVVSLRGRLNNELATFDGEGVLRPTTAYRLLRATIAKTGAKLVTLDNVAHLYAGNENDRGQVTAFINLLYQLCSEMGVTILLIAHRNKAGNSYSGSTAWLNAVRSQILLERADDNDPDARKLSLGKANYARQGEEITFRWHDFALVRDADLPAGLADRIAETAAGVRENGIFLDCLRERASQGEGRGVGPAPGPNYAPKQFEGMAQARGLKAGALKAAMDRLFTIRAIETFTYRNTAKGRDVTLIREVADAPRTPTPNAPLTPFPNTPEPKPRTTPHTLSYTTYREGAAHEGAAPSPPRRLGTPIFSAEDFADGGRGGLGDLA